jgi:hypothetical protein
MTLLGRTPSRLGNVLPDLDSAAGDDSLIWSLAVGVVVSAFLFWLFLGWTATGESVGDNETPWWHSVAEHVEAQLYCELLIVSYISAKTGGEKSDTFRLR